MSDQQIKVMPADCKERVALDLMKLILAKSYKTEKEATTEELLRELYIRCRTAVLLGG